MALMDGGWKRTASVLLVLTLAQGGCSGKPELPETPAGAPAPAGRSESSEVDARGHTAPTTTTALHNNAVAASLPLADEQDFEDARRGLIGGAGEVVIKRADGRTVSDSRDYAFEEGDAPASVNPSLWRQAKLNSIHGLFEVVPGIWQVRGYDISNITLIRGKTGWIVVDPLTSYETAKASLALARKHLGDVPVVAVILTHSHLDHFGGIEAVLPQAGTAQAEVPIIAPKGFIEEATSENVLAGVAMGRRATYMFGVPLEHSPRGHVDTGLGKAVARGGIGLVEPTVIVDHTPQKMEIDGVEFVFQYVPGSEAPAELAFYLPGFKAYCGAEIVNHTMHNIYTLRGAKVRDALLWSGYIDEAIERFGDAEVVFASHNWPVWGRERGRDYLEKQRDVYRYIHDQTLRLANQGATSQEIAEHLRLPEALDQTFAVRGYYGTTRHNAKAVYQYYFGWYDGNPAHLDPLPPEQAATKYVAAMGGATAVLTQAGQAFDAGEYRWAAMLLDHLVFAEPDNAEATELLAGTYDQLGYQAESGPWRDVYLSAAHELRHGVTASVVDPETALALLRHLPLPRFFDAMAARLDGPAAENEDLVLNFIFTDLGESWVLEIDNGVLHAHRREPDPDADVTVRLTREMLAQLSVGKAGLKEMVFSDQFEVEGSRMALVKFFSLLSRPAGDFAIVTP